MPFRDTKIEESVIQIFDPVIEQVVRGMLIRLGLYEKVRDYISITTDYRSASKTSDDYHNALLTSDRCDVSVEYNLNPSDTKWENLKFKHVNPAYYAIKNTQHGIFYDKFADIKIVEIDLPASIQLNFAITYKNTQDAYSVLNTLYLLNPKDTTFNFTDVVYHYPINSDLLYILNTIYNMLELDQTKLPFEDYINKFSDNALTKLVSRDGTQEQYVIKRKLLNILGTFDIQQSKPEPNNLEESLDSFTINFTYTFQFNNPILLRACFPSVINNKLIPTYMIPPYKETYFPALAGIYQEKCINSFLNNNKSLPNPVLRIPIWNDFVVPDSLSKFYKFQPFFISVVLLDDGDVTNIPLQELPDDLKFHDIVIGLMKEHGPEIFDNTGLLNISVYCNGVLVDKSKLSIDNELNLLINVSNRRAQYQLVVSECTSFNFISQKWIPYLIRYKSFFPLLICRNLNSILKLGHFRLVHNERLLSIMKNLLNSGGMDNILNEFIENGKCTESIYGYTTSAEQLLDYMTSVGNDKGSTIFDTFLLYCMNNCILTTRDIEPLDIMSSPNKNYLIRGVNTMNSGSINLPLRAFNTNIYID
jgi:hypothetical protein